MAHRRLDQRRRRGLAIFLLQVLFQGACVDADANRDAVVASGADHGADPVLAADVAGVDAQAVDAKFGDAQGDLVVEVDIRHQRHIHLALDAPKGLGGVHVRHTDAHDIGAGGLERPDLADGRGHVQGVGVGHALHRDRRIAAHGDVANMNLT